MFSWATNFFIQKPKADRASFDADIQIIRAYSKKVNQFSWTSDAYQRDVLSAVMSLGDTEGCVVEIGCYKGGLSAQVAYACKITGKKFIYADIDASSTKATSKLLKKMGLSDHTTGHTASLQKIVEEGLIADPVALIIIDADHEYEAVKKDIDYVLRMKNLPSAAIFHDYSLRSKATNENVEKAIKETLSAYPVKLIGDSFGGERHYTQSSPSPDGHYWEVPGSEGAMVSIH